MFMIVRDNFTTATNTTSIFTKTALTLHTLLMSTVTVGVLEDMISGWLERKRKAEYEMNSLKFTRIQ